MVYLNSVLNFEFVVCLKLMEIFSSLLMPISIALQRSGCDLLEAFEEIKNLEKIIKIINTMSTAILIGSTNKS